MSPFYNQEQTVFVLSLLSNLGSPLTGTVEEIEQTLQTSIDSELQAAVPAIGTWQIVWGPAVYQAPGSNRADNAMFVALNAATPQLVVAIAGTNPYSIFDWMIEDFFVGTQVPWASGTPPFGSHPRISAGTFVGLSILQGLMPGPGLPGAGTRLRDFLQSALTQSMNVTVTGHSLGGALSPAVGLWLNDTQATWDPGGKATLLCQPSAGPTSGNGDFASYYTHSGIGSRTTRIYNSLDMVPKAWHDTDLSAIPDLYLPAITPDALVDFFVALALDLASGGAYTQINTSTPALNGTVDTSIINPGNPAFENFLTQAGYQHVSEYMTLLGIITSPTVLAATEQAVGVTSTAMPQVAARLRVKLARRQALMAAQT